VRRAALPVIREIGAARRSGGTARQKSVARPIAEVEAISLTDTIAPDCLRNPACPERRVDGWFSGI
jgi:hypothetical protein